MIACSNDEKAESFTVRTDRTLYKLIMMEKRNQKLGIFKNDDKNCKSTMSKEEATFGNDMVVNKTYFASIPVQENRNEIEWQSEERKEKIT